MDKSVQEKLAEYRAKKSKENKTPLIHRLFGNGNSIKTTIKHEQNRPVNNHDKYHSEAQEDQEGTDNDGNHTFRPADLEEPPWIRNYIPEILKPNYLKICLWFILWGLFIELQFGAVYFVLSMFYVVYANTGSRVKKDGAPSAYSVFNPNCERLDGTFTAEQFEQELRYGAGSVR
ncbi:uncharacterized protein LOC106152802 [Lingula anatina]|uniref:Uncharacterized protein LOC106152802 n=1 Tax=Lingula anatina TaxID=7574 RepID=A0A1S3H7P4_LINAN|nr:uncharacterized protein LOC106152802 [Lingula anatina]|eukprot:XP_013381997.1 uncharacterized protein LOC106152802 [Lingula anatina]